MGGGDGWKGNTFGCSVIVSLPQVWIQEIKCMTVVNFTHGLFLTCTQKSLCIYKLCITIFTEYTAISNRTNPCISNQAKLLYLLREPASLLVVMNPHPPLTLVCQQLSHPLAFTPLTLSHPTGQITYLHRRPQQSWLSSSRTVIMLSKPYQAYAAHSYLVSWYSRGWLCRIF